MRLIQSWHRGEGGCSVPQNSAARRTVEQACVIVPVIWSARGPPSFPFSLTHVRERSADWRYFIVWHLVEGALVPCGHAASRRSTVASSTPGPSRRVRTGDFHLRDPGGFRRPSSGPYRPSFEGSPSF